MEPWAVTLIVFFLCVLILRLHQNLYLCGPPQLPLLNLQLRRGCLSGHGDEEEGTID